MNIYLSRHLLLLTSVSLLSACTVAKLEARLEANPQWKDVVNPKTGALMPCPGSDKAFYREVGLAPAKPKTAANIPPSSAPVAESTSSAVQGSLSAATASAASSKNTAPAQADCKPQIHKKTGGTLPCPALD
jgi:hypothetical protein